MRPLKSLLWIGILVENPSVSKTSDTSQHRWFQSGDLFRSATKRPEKTFNIAEKPTKTLCFILKYVRTHSIPLYFLQYRCRIKRSSNSKKVKMANVECRIKRSWSQTFKSPNVELNEGRIKRDKSVVLIRSHNKTNMPGVVTPITFPSIDCWHHSNRLETAD